MSVDNFTASMWGSWNVQNQGSLNINHIWWYVVHSTHLFMLFSMHYNEVVIGVIASQITSLTIVYSIVYSDADQRKYQSSASLAFVRWIHRGPMNSPHKWSVTRNMFPFDDVIMGHHASVRFSETYVEMARHHHVGTIIVTPWDFARLIVVP